MTFDDRLWRDVWERNLDHVERHTIAVAVWRRRHPETPFEGLVALELARRWRRHIWYLMSVYGLWTLFWGSIAVYDLRAAAAGTPAPPLCASFGILVMAACLAMHRRLGIYLRVNGRPSG